MHGKQLNSGLILCQQTLFRGCATEQIFARNEGPEGLACNAIQLLLHLRTWFTCLGIMCARSSCLLPDEPFESGGGAHPGGGYAAKFGAAVV